MTKEGERAQEAPQKRSGVYAGGALLITTMILISILFTGGIAYSVQSIVGGGGEPDEGVWVDGVREFEISAAQWSFGPVNIKADPGDTVRFIVTSGDIMHGFAVNELGLNLALSPDVGVTQEVMIPPDMPEGTYTAYCSIFCGIGHPYMKARLVVGDPGVEIGKILPYVATFIMAGMFATFAIIGRRRAR